MYARILHLHLFLIYETLNYSFFNL